MGMQLSHRRRLGAGGLSLKDKYEQKQRSSIVPAAINRLTRFLVCSTDAKIKIQWRTILEQGVSALFFYFLFAIKSS